MTSEFITLSDSSFRILLQKFVEEIAELKSAIQTESTASELRLQLEEAVTQSVELHEELKQVYRMYQQAQTDKRRLSDDELNALRYFGFATPPDGVIASDARSEGSLIALPPRRALSNHREPSVEDETETDVIDILDTMRHMQRSVASPSEDESRKSLGRDAVTPRPAVLRQDTTPLHLAPPTLAGTSTERQRTAGSIAAPASAEFELREQRLSWEEKVLQLERELLHAKTALLDQREEAQRVSAAREKAAADAARDWDEQRRALERQSKEWEARCDTLHAEFRRELQMEREHGLLKDKELDMCKAELHRASQAQEDLWREVSTAKRSALAESLGQLTEATKLLTATDREVLLDDRARITEIAREIDAELRGALQRRSAPPTAARDSMRSIMDAYEAIRQGEVVSYSLGGVSDLDAVDTAVLDTLHRLKFPFVIALRRLGPGDYFIDRRLHVRLTNGEVTVQTVSTEGVRQKSSLMTLIQYLLHLYAPLLPPQPTSEDPSWGQPSSASANEATSAMDHDLSVLTERESALRSAVHAHRELLSVHNSQKAAELSPSPSDRPPAPSASTRSNKWLRPPSPSPVSAFQEAPIVAAQSDHTNERLKQAQRELMERFAASSKRRSTREGHGSAVDGSAALLPRKPLDLSQLSSEELEQLKRAALAQQVREMKRLGSHPKSVR